MAKEYRIVTYHDSLKDAFIALNKAWLEEFFYVEEKDLKMFDQAKEIFIEQGGEIFFCVSNEIVSGTVAMMKVDDQTYELCKMAVSKEHQGKGLANLLIDACIAFAKQKKIEKIILFSNTILKPAINLYKKYGFEEVPLPNTSYARSNIYMELKMN